MKCKIRKSSRTQIHSPSLSRAHGELVGLERYLRKVNNSDLLVNGLTSWQITYFTGGL